MAMRDGLALHDQHDHLMGWNPPALAITGLTRNLAAERWAANLPDGVVDLSAGKWVEAHHTAPLWLGLRGHAVHR
jgi:hypothetical protein